jgi:hypothetical protein
VIAPRAPFTTPFGTVMLPDFLEPCWPVEPDELADLRRHMGRIGIPAAVWKQWQHRLGVGKVMDVRTLHTFVGLLLLVCDYHLSVDVESRPDSEIGREVYAQKFRKKSQIALTADPADLL